MTKQEYLLICLCEELAEMQQEISKCLRFSPSDKHPDRAMSNIEYLNDEAADVEAVIEMLRETGFYLQPSQERRLAKRNRVLKYMEDSIRVGVLDDNSDNRR